MTFYKKKSIPIWFVLPILLLLAVVGYLFWQNQQLKQGQTTADVGAVVEKVGKLIELPQGETPTVANVTDVQKLRNQPFFARAQNGDQVLIYSKAGKAILYRPFTNKVIEIAPISSETSLSGQGTNPLPTRKIVDMKNLTVAIYNGGVTGSAELTQKVESQLRDKYPTIKIISKEESVQKDYTNTQVVDVSGAKKEQAQELATFLGGVVAELPHEETKPIADILIIAVE
jgi:hypothetical protein